MKFFHNSIKRTVNPIINNYLRSVIRKHNFWYVDIPRTSSSSIRVELGKYYGSPFGKKNIFEKHLSSSFIIYRDHLSATDMIKKLGNKLWDEIFTFTFVRNPWDRILSFYYYRKKCNEIPIGITLKEYINAINNKKLDRYGLPLDSFEYKNCSDYLFSDGKISVDYIGKYETREKDLSNIAKIIGWNKTENLHLQTARPLSAQYKEYFDRQMIEIIEDLFMSDITIFNYSF